MEQYNVTKKKITSMLLLIKTCTKANQWLSQESQSQGFLQNVNLNISLDEGIEFFKNSITSLIKGLEL